MIEAAEALGKGVTVSATCRVLGVPSCHLSGEEAQDTSCSDAGVVVS